MVDLFNTLETLFHAFDGYVVAGLEGLGFQDFRKCALAFLAD
jgi:hypothetical protein